VTLVKDTKVSIMSLLSVHNYRSGSIEPVVVYNIYNLCFSLDNFISQWACVTNVTLFKMFKVIDFIFYAINKFHV